MIPLIRTAVIVTLAGWLVACGGSEERAARYLASAQQAFDDGDYIKAQLDAKNALQIEPNSFAASYLMSEIAEKENRPQELFRFLQRSAQIDPSNIDVQVKLGRIYAAAQMLDEARAAVDAIQAVAPEDPEGKVLEAIIVARQGDPERGRAMAEAVLADHPRNISALALLAAWHQTDDPDKSLALLDQGISYEPDNRTLREIKIGMLQKLGRLDEAEQELRDLIATFPGRNQYRYALARYLASRDRADDAEQVLRDLVAADPEDLTAKLTLAQFLGQQVDADAALTLLDGYIAEQPDVYQYRFAKATIMAVEKRYDEARKIFGSIIERDGLGPNGLSARTKLAALEFTAGDPIKGRALIEEVIKSEPGNADALVMRASVALSEGKSDDAIIDLRNVLRGEPGRENAQLLLGKAHLQAGEQNLAIEALQKLIDSHPGNVSGRKDLSRLLMQAGRWDDVRALLAVGVQQAPEDLAFARMYIDTLMRLEDWDEAGVQAQRVLELDPGKALGHYVQGRVDQARGQFTESITSFKVALDLEPNAVETLTSLIRSYVRMDDTNGALSFLREFLAAHPDSVHGYTLLGEMQARAGKMQDAIASTEKALELRDGWLPAYRNLIGIHLREGDMEAADEVVERGLEGAPGNPELLLLRANIRERESRYAEAIEIYGQVLETNPGIEVAINNYVALVADHARQPEMLQRALNYGRQLEASQNPIFQDTVGWLQYQLGDYQAALELLEKAVRRAGQLPQLRYHLGMAYYRLDRLELARTELEAAVKDPQASYTGIDEARATLGLL